MTSKKPSGFRSGRADADPSVRRQLDKFQREKAVARHRDATPFSRLVDQSMQALGLGRILDEKGPPMSEQKGPAPPDTAAIYELTESELALLDKHLTFYVELTSGKRRPTTEAQRHFIAVSMGHDVASTDHERAFMKWRRKMARGRAAETSTEDVEQAPPGLRPYPSSISAKLDRAYDPGLSPNRRGPRER